MLWMEVKEVLEILAALDLVGVQEDVEMEASSHLLLEVAQTFRTRLETLDGCSQNTVSHVNLLSEHQELTFVMHQASRRFVISSNHPAAPLLPWTR
jgi:hypothetical protein